MHEASVAQGILAIALEEFARHGGEEARIECISCELGLLACVEEETLKGCFELLAEDTPAEAARLELTRAPLQCNCADCAEAFMLAKKKFVCPGCGGGNIRFTGGSGIVLTGIRVQKMQKEN